MYQSCQIITQLLYAHFRGPCYSFTLLCYWIKSLLISSGSRKIMFLCPRKALPLKIVLYLLMQDSRWSKLCLTWKRQWGESQDQRKLQVNSVKLVKMLNGPKHFHDWKAFFKHSPCFLMLMCFPSVWRLQGENLFLCLHQHLEATHLPWFAVPVL